MCKPSVKTILLLISVIQTVDSNVWIQCTKWTLNAQHIKSYLFRWKNNNMWYHENISKFKKNDKKSQHCSVAQVTLSCKNKCLCHLSRRIQKQILKRRKWDVLFNLTPVLQYKPGYSDSSTRWHCNTWGEVIIILIMNFSSSFQSGPESFIFNDPKGLQRDERKSFRPPFLLCCLFSSIRIFLRRAKGDDFALPDFDVELVFEDTDLRVEIIE